MLVAIVAGTTLSGCNLLPGREPAGPASSSAPPQISLEEGALFESTGFKIKSVITPQTATTLDPLTLEIYVDSRGNGMGLAGYRDLVYDVVLSGGKIYVKVADNVAVQISNLSSHLVPTDVDYQTSQDLSALGFTLIDGNVASYKAAKDVFLIDNTYTLSDMIFEQETVAAGNTMTVNEFVNYILGVSGIGYVKPSGDDDKDTSISVIPEGDSFYNNSEYGINIRGTVYSIGDFCNPSTYFESLVPETITPSYAYNGDIRVELRHINYQASDGRTTFVSTEGYVQSITTDSNFTWSVFSKGMSTDEVQYILGVRLSRDEKETWEPVSEDWVVATSKTGHYTIQIGTYTIELTCGSRSKMLESITISNYIDFLK